MHINSFLATVFLPSAEPNYNFWTVFCKVGLMFCERSRHLGCRKNAISWLSKKHRGASYTRSAYSSGIPYKLSSFAVITNYRVMFMNFELFTSCFFYEFTITNSEFSLILRIRGAPVRQKLGMILDNKVVQKLKLEKNGFLQKMVF